MIQYLKCHFKDKVVVTKMVDCVWGMDAKTIARENEIIEECGRLYGKVLKVTTDCPYGNAKSDDNFLFNDINEEACEEYERRRKLPVNTILDLKKEPKLEWPRNKYVVILSPKKIICKRLSEYEALMLQDSAEDEEYIMELMFNRYKCNVESVVFVEKPPVMVLRDMKNNVVGTSSFDEEVEKTVRGEVEVFEKCGRKTPDWLVFYTDKGIVKVMMTERMRELYVNRYRAYNKDGEYDGCYKFVSDYADLLGIDLDKCEYELQYGDKEIINVGW